MFISLIDCKDAHNTLLATERARRLLGVRTPYGILRFTRGLFGLKPMAREFNAGVADAIAHLRELGVFAYADDIVILAKSFEEALSLLEKTLEALR